MTVLKAGIDLKERSNVVFGSKYTRSSFTSKADVARSVAQLAILSMGPPGSLADKVPDHVRISGCPRSAAEIATAIEDAMDENNEADKTRFTIIQKDLSTEKANLKQRHLSGQELLPRDHIL